ncbi:hypothetical protein NQ314_021282 [Rhamnusium bicolor]|uniref:Insulin-like domain-containing protein n=1 Tax=Rhamnusium bicolor TaxID=1586634 RepID=A0AAV8WJC0_9CUCU|nr:hypothetical protein NQ314_021282 [Rhamnusium bicolor]
MHNSDILNYNEYEEGADNNLDASDLIFPFLQKDSAKSLIPRKVRKTPGIVNECCYNSCSKEHLQLYCAA